MNNLERAKHVPTVDLHGASIRRTDWSGTIFRRANLSRADCSDANFRGVDFMDALLVGTILRGADLTDAKNLTIEQLAVAFIDDRTRLPSYIDRKKLIEQVGNPHPVEGVTA